MGVTSNVPIDGVGQELTGFWHGLLHIKIPFGWEEEVEGLVVLWGFWFFFFFFCLFFFFGFVLVLMVFFFVVVVICRG